MNYQALRNKEETARVGSKWTKEEDEQLIAELSNDMSYDDIANAHKRTIVGIKSRVISQIILPICRDDNIDELSFKYNIDKDMIQKYIDKTNIRSSIQTTTRHNTANGNKLSLLQRFSQMENKLIALEHKLDYVINLLR